MENFNKYISLYKATLEEGYIQKAYTGLVKYVSSLKAHFSKIYTGRFSCGNISPGYMDYTYFPFFDEYLRDKKLRFGIVLNHEKMRFELWLMGQNLEVQKEYWDLLKSTKWNKDKTTKPQYSELVVVLIDKPDFDRLDILSQSILEEATKSTTEIIDYLKSNS